MYIVAGVEKGSEIRAGWRRLIVMWPLHPERLCEHPLDWAVSAVPAALGPIQWREQRLGILLENFSERRHCPTQFL